MKHFKTEIWRREKKSTCDSLHNPAVGVKKWPHKSHMEIGVHRPTAAKHSSVFTATRFHRVSLFTVKASGDAPCFGASLQQSPALMQRPRLTRNSSLCHRDTWVTGGIALNTRQAAYDGRNAKQVIKTCKDPTPIKMTQPWILFHTLLIKQALIYSWKLDAGELWHACPVIQEIRNRFCDKPDTSWPGPSVCLEALSCSTPRGGVCSALSSLWTFSFISTE